MRCATSVARDRCAIAREFHSSPHPPVSHIQIIAPGDADPVLADAYREVAGRRGQVANILGVSSVHPTAMVAHLRLYMSLMFHASELTRQERETVAVAVSRANDCFY